MTVFVQTVVSGLLIGALYGLIGIGFSMSYLTAGMLNFAQGDLLAVGAYLMLEFNLNGLPLGVSFLLAAVIVGLGTALLERVAWRPLYRYGLIYATLCSFGVSIIIESGIQLIWGAVPRNLPPLFSPSTFSVGSVHVSPEQLVGFGVSVVLCGAIVWLLARTRSGMGMRTLATDTVVASLVGVRTSRLLFVAFGISGVLAVVAAAILAPQQGLTPGMGSTLTILGFTAAAVGGFGSVAGAFLGGLVVGVLQGIVTVYINPSYENVIVYALLIVVLFARPRGLLGEKKAEARAV